MDIHFSEPSQAEAIRGLLQKEPHLRPKQIAARLGCREEYVRAVKHRAGCRNVDRRLKAALGAAMDAYSVSLQLRRESETDPNDRQVYAAYCSAWHIHKAAENAYLELLRDTDVPRQAMRERRDTPPIKGVNVRDILQKQGRIFGSGPTRRGHL